MSMNPKLMAISTSNNPYYNQALEEYFLLQRNGPVLLIYRNSPSVIIGRCQNPWKECSLEEIKKKGIFLVRRLSGGGTVYNDLGNCNFSFFQSRQAFEPKENLKMIQDYITAYGVKTEINERNDLLLNGKKISGSAYRHTKDRTMHHFSLLVETEKRVIEEYLNPSLKEGRFKGVFSVISNVGRLIDEEAFPRTDDFINSIIGSWKGKNPHFYNEEDCRILPGVSERIKAFQEWAWLYGKTPEFSYCLSTEGDKDLEITVRNGRYYSVTVYL